MRFGTHSSRFKSVIPAKAGIQLAFIVENSWINIVMQVNPVWIMRFNHIDLPFPVPFLDLLLPADCSIHAHMVFIPNQTLHVILRSKPGYCTILVRGNAVPECRSYANIDGSPRATRKDVHGGKFFFTH